MTRHRLYALPLFAFALIALASCAVTPDGSGSEVLAEPLRPNDVTQAVAGDDGGAMPPLAPSAGINANPMTAPLQDLQALRTRIDSLEKTVLSLQAELNKTVPALVKLAAIQREIGDLSSALQAVDQQPIALDSGDAPAAKPVMSTPKMVGMSPILDQQGGKTRPVSVKKTQGLVTTPPPIQAAASSVDKTAPQTSADRGAHSAPSVTGLRLGVNKGVTRLVLEGKTPITAKTDIDNTEKIMIIDLPATGWDLATLPKAPADGVIANLAVDQDGTGGHRLVIQLRSGAALVGQSALAPSADHAGHRFVIDLKPVG